MTGPHRQPAAFTIPAPETGPEPAAKPQPQRKPLVAPAGAVVTVTPDALDPFLAEQESAALPPTPEPAKSGFRLRSVFLGALGALVALGFGLWIDSLIRSLFARADWLGWTATGLAALAALSFAAILVRELSGLARLASVARLQARAADARAHRQPDKARALVRDVSGFLSGRPETQAGRQALDALAHDIIDGPDLLDLAEKELLSPLDATARQLVSDAARRVSVVTAVSPRALIDVGYVLFEAARLMRAVSAAYGGRPGTLGFMRLARSVMSHLAVTGTLAASDTLVSQVLGHGLASRLSARLGEGVVNGMMTARIGIAAMEASRPMPFAAVRAPRMSDFLSGLARLSPTGDETKG